MSKDEFLSRTGYNEYRLIKIMYFDAPRQGIVALYRGHESHQFLLKTYDYQTPSQATQISYECVEWVV